MNSNNPIRSACACSTRSVRVAIVTLILCLGLGFSVKSTASTIPPVADSNRVEQPAPQRLDPKPIRLTEAGARQVLKDKADLIMLQGVVASQDTLLSERNRVIAAQSQIITRLNQRQQANANIGTTAASQTDHYRKRLHAARLENWIVRGAAVLYVVVRLRLI